MTLAVFDHPGHGPAPVDECACAIVVDSVELPDTADLACVAERNANTPGWG